MSIRRFFFHLFHTNVATALHHLGSGYKWLRPILGPIIRWIEA